MLTSSEKHWQRAAELVTPGATKALLAALVDLDPTFVAVRPPVCLVLALRVVVRTFRVTAELVLKPPPDSVRLRAALVLVLPRRAPRRC